MVLDSKSHLLLYHAALMQILNLVIYRLILLTMGGCCCSSDLICRPLGLSAWLIYDVIDDVSAVPCWYLFEKIVLLKGDSRI